VTAQVKDGISEGDGRGFLDSYRAARAERGGGGLFTELVSDRLGSFVAAVAIRKDIHPTTLTLAGLALALTASAAVATRSSEAHAMWPWGFAAFAGWQLAYVLDCADGQVARATGKQSEFGARIDILVDFSVQSSIVSTFVSIIARWSGLPPVVLAIFATMWFVNIVIFLLGKADGNVGHSFSVKKTGVVGIVKLVRDYGFVLLVLSGWLVIAPHSLVIPVAAVTFINACFLLATIMREASLSMRHPVNGAEAISNSSGRVLR
jgi:phosphatidylglycerophosphate synthase